MVLHHIGFSNGRESLLVTDQPSFLELSFEFLVTTLERSLLRASVLGMSIYLQVSHLYFLLPAVGSGALICMDPTRAPTRSWQETRRGERDQGCILLPLSLSHRDRGCLLNRSHCSCCRNLPSVVLVRPTLHAVLLGAGG